ncbi:hypothetical protein AB1L88_26160 [Tautonia sp. JC769]
MIDRTTPENEAEAPLLSMRDVAKRFGASRALEGAGLFRSSR